MTRFESELNGSLGAFWKAEAEKELARVKADYEGKKITIDADGVARNCIGRVLMDDMLEKLAMVTNEVDIESTREARSEEVSRELKVYRASRRERSKEERWEMRAAFGEGATVIDVISGRRITF